MLAQILYGWLVIVGLYDLCLVAPALRRTENAQTIGRLLSTVGVLAGMVLVGYGRVVEAADSLPSPVLIGMLLVDIGLLGYALYLPERGILSRLHERRRR